MVMKQYVMNAEPALIKQVDQIIKEEKLHSSRNEFIRDAIRSKVLEHKAQITKKFFAEGAKRAIENGWNGEMPTREERAKIADEFLKEKGLKLLR